jgi:amidase
MDTQRAFGQLRPPTAIQVASYADSLGWNLGEAEVAALTEQVAASVSALDMIEELEEPTPELKYTQRDPGHTPVGDEDPFNAFIRFCDVPGAKTGPLAGRTVGVKDCIAVAGVPMTNGGRRNPVQVPTEDAVVIERLLDAGARITGKTNLEDLGMGLGEGSYYGASRNPLNPQRSTGGSSSGSGAAVAAGQVDLALGADEGGSVRIPAAWCGLVGMKATHGLVPSYGMTYMDHTLDHIGPMTRTVMDNALMLEVLAGPDDRDPQWLPPGATFEPSYAGLYTRQSNTGVKGLRVGIVAESLDPVGATEGVKAAFNKVAKTLESLGATVYTVNVPLWTHGWLITSAALTAGLSSMALSYGTGNFGHLGRIDPQAVATLAAQARLGGSDLPPMLKNSLLVGQHVRQEYMGLPFVKAHNLRRELTKQVNRALQKVDVLVTPTTPGIAHELAERVTVGQLVSERIGTSTRNTSPLDMTGHPALTVPGGLAEDDMPAGFQIIGPHFGEQLCYQVGFAVEAI